MFGRQLERWPFPISYKVAKRHHRRYLGRKVVPTKILGTFWAPSPLMTWLATTGSPPAGKERESEGKPFTLRQFPLHLDKLDFALVNVYCSTVLSLLYYSIRCGGETLSAKCQKKEHRRKCRLAVTEILSALSVE